MSSLKQLRHEQQLAAQHQQVITELNSLVKDIQRCEKTIAQLQQELKAVNAQTPAKRTTREDITYLTQLLDCAKKKLTWEKHIASLQKRTPLVLERMRQMLTDPQHPPSEAARAEMMKALQSVQAAMERLQHVEAPE